MVMGYHTGGKIKCFNYDYKHKTQLERKNSRRKFFNADEFGDVNAMHPLDFACLDPKYDEIRRQMRKK